VVNYCVHHIRTINTIYTNKKGDHNGSPNILNFIVIIYYATAVIVPAPAPAAADTATAAAVVATVSVIVPPANKTF